MAFVSNDAFRHACPVCRDRASVPCDGCDEVFYCTKAHRDNDLDHQPYCLKLKGRVKVCREGKSEGTSTFDANRHDAQDSKLQALGTYTSGRSKSALSQAAARILFDNIDRFRSQMEMGYNFWIPNYDKGHYTIFMDKTTGELVRLDASAHCCLVRSREGRVEIGQEISSYAWRHEGSQLESFRVMIDHKGKMFRYLNSKPLPYIVSFVEGYNCLASTLRAALIFRSIGWSDEEFNNYMADTEHYPSKVVYQMGCVLNFLILFLAFGVLNGAGKGSAQFKKPSH